MTFSTNVLATTGVLGGEGQVSLEEKDVPLLLGLLYQKMTSFEKNSEAN